MNLDRGIPRGCPPQLGKVEIVMLATPEVASYSWFGETSWASYAERQGYSFQVCRENLVPDMHMNWSKIEFVRSRLAATDAEYLLLVDADSFVFNPAESLEYLWQTDRRIVFSNDQGFPRPGRLNIGRRHLLRLQLRQWKLPNAGFVMMKVEHYARSFFDRWLDYARDDFKHWSDIHPRNQNVLWRALLPSEHRHIGILDKQVVRLTHPSQIKHLTRLQPFAVHYKHTVIPASSLRDLIPAFDQQLARKSVMRVAP